MENNCCEIHAAHLVAAIILGLANRARSVFGRPGKRPEAVFTAQVLPFEKNLGASEEVRPTWDAEISHAAGQGRRRNTAVGDV